MPPAAAKVAGVQGGGTVYYAHEAAGAPAARFERNAWGRPIGAGESSPTRLGWQSNWLRLKEGLCDAHARTYSAEMGRFLQRDPARAVADYAYGSNQPSLRMDPTGEDTAAQDRLVPIGGRGAR